MNSHPFLDVYIILIFFIMFFTGIICGVINVLFAKDIKHPQFRDTFSHALLGIIAAFTTPLFLHIFSSDLLENLYSNNLNVLAFTGFCIFFTLFFVKIFEFLIGIKIKILNIDAENSKKLKENKNEQNSGSVPDDEGFSEESYKIMHTMSEVDENGKSLSSLFEDSGLTVEKVNEQVSTLIAQGYIKQKLNDKGKLCLYLSPHAFKIIEKMKKENPPVK